MVYTFGVNAGALLAGLGIWAVSEAYGWDAGFLTAAAAMLAGQLIFILGQKHLQLVETDLPQEENQKTPFISNNLRYTLIAFAIFLPTLYWSGYETFGALFNEFVVNFKQQGSGFFLAGIDIPITSLMSLNSFYLMLMSGIILIIWYVKNRRSIVRRFGLAFILFSLSSILFLAMSLTPIQEINGEEIFVLLSGVFALQAISEIFISALLLSYLTRVSPVKASSTIMGLYYTVSFLLMKAFTLGENFISSDALAGWVITGFIIGILLLIFRKKLEPKAIFN